MNSAVRRTGTYLYSSASWSAPRSVRAPHTTRPFTGKARRQLMPSGLSIAVLGVGEIDVEALARR